jgi:uncharacterized protein (DUF58 family)
VSRGSVHGGPGPASLRERFIRWATRRHPCDGRSATITRNRVYILPTRQGYLLLLVLLGMLLGAINYENSMAFLLTFLVVGIGHNTMWYTHRNLLGLQVHALPVAPVFAGDTPRLRLRLEEDRHRPREALRLTLDGAPGSPVHLPADGQTEIEAPLRPLPRGIHPLPRQRLSTRYPLGLLEAWTWLQLEAEVVVYPQPLDPGLPPEALAAEEAQTATRLPGAEGAPEEIRAYRPGDPPRRILWRVVARTGHLHVRDAGPGAGNTLWFDWQSLHPADPEQRLSVLCHRVLEAHAAGRSYGLRLPGHSLGPATGLAHRDACLRALAGFEGHRGTA